MRWSPQNILIPQQSQDFNTYTLNVILRINSFHTLFGICSALINGSNHFALVSSSQKPGEVTGICLLNMKPSRSCAQKVLIMLPNWQHVTTYRMHSCILFSLIFKSYFWHRDYFHHFPLRRKALMVIWWIWASHASKPLGGKLLWGAMLWRWALVWQSLLILTLSTFTWRDRILAEVTGWK